MRGARAGAKEEHRPFLRPVREHCADVGREPLWALLPVELAPYGPVRVGIIVEVNVVASWVLL
jgi:hypothetical protein